MSLYSAKLPSLRDKLAGASKEIDKTVENVKKVEKKAVKGRRLNK